MLAELLRSQGEKFITLSKRLGASESSIRVSLEGLMKAGYVQRNPGYGHPMRPEYILTAPGNRIASRAFELWEQMTDAQLEEILLRKWSLPCIAACVHGSRYADIKATLNGVTDRALSAVLRSLCTHGLVNRAVLDDFPPITVYQLTQDWQEFGQTVARLEKELSSGIAGV